MSDDARAGAWLAQKIDEHIKALKADLASERVKTADVDRLTGENIRLLREQNEVLREIEAMKESAKRDRADIAEYAGRIAELTDARRQALEAGKVALDRGDKAVAQAKELLECLETIEPALGVLKTMLGNAGLHIGEERARQLGYYARGAIAKAKQ